MIYSKITIKFLCFTINLTYVFDTKTTLGEIKTYTLVRDALKADQWYYMPKSLRLVEKRTVDGKKQPKLTVIRYQYALLNSTTGIAIKGEVKYNGLLPPCGITVKGNWNNVYKYIENNKFFSANAGGAWSWFAGSGSIQRSKQSIKDEMKTRLGLEINEYTCEKNSQAMDTYLQNIIDKVRDEVFTRSALDSARTFELLQQQLKDTNMTQAVKNRIMQRLSFLSVSVESRQSMKEVTKRKSGQIDFSYNKHQQVERETRIDGALSLSAYHFTQAELKNYIIDIKAGDWPIAIFGLPQAVNTDLGVRSMSIDIGYKLPNGVLLKEARQWTPEKGWATLAGKENNLIQFTLLGVDKKIDMTSLEFDAKLNIVSNIPNSTFSVQRKIKAFNGESNFSAVEQLTKQFIIDATSLDFAKITSAPTDLDYVQVLINQGQKVFSKNIKPYFKDGVAGSPNLVSLLMGNEGVPINFEVFYVKTNGEKIKSKQTFTLGDISLGNFDWKE